MKKNIKNFTMIFALCFIPVITLYAGPFDALRTVSDVLDKADKIKTTTEKTITVVQSIDRAAEPITSENAYYIGRSVGASVLNTYSLYNNPRATTYLNRICKAITINSPVPSIYKDYCVAILDSYEINAISTSSGMILISLGLLESTESEDEIAAVLAHELAHIQLEHSIGVIKSSRAKDVITSSAKLADDAVGKYSKLSSTEKELFHTFANANNLLVDTITTKGYPKDQEYKADAEALNLLLAAGYDPNAMGSMLSKLDASYAAHDGQDGWTKTHPKPADRLKKVTAICKTLKYEGAEPSVRAPRFKTNMNGIK